MPRPGEITTKLPLEALKAQGERIAKRRGHKLRDWLPTPGRDGAAFSSCEKCGAGVWADPNPAPNDIDLSGRALALTCTGIDR